MEATKKETVKSNVLPSIKPRRVLVCLIMLVLVSFGVALTLKAAVGVGAWDAFSQSISNLTGIQVGTVTMLLNFACVGIELIVLKGKININLIMQVIISMVIGFGVNFFYYDILGNVEIQSYFVRIVLLVAGLTINAITGGCLMMLNLGTFAVEGACKTIGDKIGKPFHKLRQGVDVISVIGCVLMVLLTGVPLTVREGTVIGLLIYGPLMGVAVKCLKPLFQKYDLTDEA